MKLSAASLFFCFFHFILLNSIEYSSAIMGSGIFPAQINEFPFVVAFVRDDPSKPINDHVRCSGALITQRHILTAAHCFIIPLPMLVHVGSRDIKGGEKYKINWWLTYADWANHKHTEARFKKNDIAIAKLEKDAIFSLILPILSYIHPDQLIGATVIGAGWAATNEARHPRFMNKAEFQVMKPADAEALYTEITGIYRTKAKNDLMIEAKKNDSSPVQPHAYLTFGESGTPFIKKRSDGGLEIVAVYRSIVPPVRVSSTGRMNAGTSLYYYRKFISEVSKYEDNILVESLS